MCMVHHAPPPHIGTVMEYVDMGQVLTYDHDRHVFLPFTGDSKLSESMARTFFRDIVEAVAYCTWRSWQSPPSARVSGDDPS